MTVKHVFALLVSLSCAAVPAMAEDPDTKILADPDPEAAVESTVPPLVLVNDEPIHTADVKRRLKRIHSSALKEERSGFDMDQLIFRLVNDVLIGQEARALGMDQDPKIVEQVSEHRDELLLRILDDREIRDRIDPAEEEVRRRFEQQYRRVEMRVVSSYDEAGAVQMLEELRNGADMEKMALERSVDPIRVRGGLMKPAPRVDLQREVAQTAFALEVGEIGGPVRTKLGWTVLRVESFADADPAQYEEVGPWVRDLIRQDAARVLRAQLAQRAREHHSITVDRVIVEAMTPKRLPDARLVAEPPEGAVVVATIGDRQLLATDYAAALIARWKGVRNLEAAEAAAPIILDRMIERELLLAEAERRGYDELPELQRQLHAYETRLLVPKYLEEIIASNVEVTQEQMKAYYEENKSRFHRPPRVRLGQITVATPDQAQRFADMLRDKADLTWLAKQHSSDGYAERGGDRGWQVPKPKADEFQDWLLGAQVGDVHDPEAVGEGFVVFQVIGREEQGPYEYLEVSGNVRDLVFRQKFAEELDRFIDTLRSRSEIKIDQERIASLRISGSFEADPEQKGHHGGH